MVAFYRGKRLMVVKNDDVKRLLWLFFIVISAS